MVTVVCNGWEDVPSFNSARGTDVALVNDIMDNNLSARWS